ncbi:DUF4331 domain-containing protein [Agrilutibacter solisilvae]|uniref:DUF4331 domain-containing protein n=1 Tax=Agrilutibacter solisilvae TaxID=2763317 RepID=A0A974XZD7_9GAMM|nr:DUF4331 domain-containing protein [Lysobacter solisilvae]QSX77703.1 DUF4331 domain-containing protein [Lysobacter solisilvae]
MSSTKLRKTRIAAGLATAGLLASGVLVTGVAVGSSHREAPLITQMPKIDATDFYMFRSYEPGRANFVTFLANYQPLQAPYGGPNYFLMDPHALYAIHIDNDGDAIEDISYFFRFYNQQRALTVPVNGMDIPVPLSNIGAFGDTTAQDGNRNVSESYVVVSSRNGRQAAARNLGFGGYLFAKPSDNIGRKSIPNYSAYAGRHITRIGVDQCATEGRVFAGQRKEGFAVNLGEVFDLVNTNPVGPPDGEKNTLEDANVTTIALELPIACLTANGPIIGAWTAAYRRLQPDGPYVQLSRLSAPLVNEVVIGLPDKDRFNGSHPAGDASFAKYVTNPSLPILLQALFGVRPPTQYPRTDLVAAFLTGVSGLNQPTNVRPAEMMRLNTSIAPRPALTQQSLGVLAGDTAGFPNGRRPGDDVVDIELRVAMGALLPANVAPDGQLPYTDGAWVSARGFSVNFPYLGTPLPGSPN